MMWTIREFRGVYHVVPVVDADSHRMFGCWCRPRLESRKLALSPVWLHRTKPSGREWSCRASH